MIFGSLRFGLNLAAFPLSMPSLQRTIRTRCFMRPAWGLAVSRDRWNVRNCTHRNYCQCPRELQNAFDSSSVYPPLCFSL